jgi:hypothetical protein
MGTKRDAPATVNADKWFSIVIQADCIDRTCPCAFAAADAQCLLNDYTAALTLRKGFGRAG